MCIRDSRQPPAAAPTKVAKEPEPASWNAAPLVPDTDDIPF